MPDQNEERVADEAAEPPISNRFYQRSGPGGSASALIGYSDGIKRATKVLANPQQNIVLVNELIVARLAQLIAAPCPRGEIVKVDDTILAAVKRDIPELAASVPGLCFGSEWIEGNYSPGEAILRATKNRSSLAGLVILYTWTRNTNMDASHLVWRTLGDGSTEVFGFDHGHCFDYQWNDSIKAQKSNSVLRSLPIISAVLKREDFDSYLDSLNGLSGVVIESVTLGIPPEWGTPPALLKALVEYLDESRPKVTEVIRAGFSA